ncbi:MULTISPECIES: hypothetical protein [unclassified Pseudomonas]|uniref:hypothetical protein n=1 Tax=unclassified Pseudomonas TaxID=196821 RepID=UPI000CD2F9AC|nr:MULTISPECIES: hypothetical protein [unclassified Pseudomonas]POA50760.1 hypothetical protein C1889_30595 [Pseudomonas sp. FW507-12TSA]
MIPEIEELMLHWARQLGRVGDGGGLGSPMATIIEWGGSAPRGTPGPRLPGGGAGLDHIASEVAAALAQIGRQSQKGAVLVQLANNRYLPAKPLTVRAQLVLLNLPPSADRTYRNWVHRLHQQVQVILATRTVTARGGGRRSGAVETDLTRASMERRRQA